MRCYRIARKKYAYTLSGEGARLYGGRWNSEGTSLIYTAATSSLAMLEMLVQRSVHLVGSDYYIMTIEIPESATTKIITLRDLATSWDAYPLTNHTKRIGNSFVAQNEHLLLSVPSTVNALENNILINDHHADFKNVSIESVKPIIFDKRLVI